MAWRGALGVLGSLLMVLSPTAVAIEKIHQAIRSPDAFQCSAHPLWTSFVERFISRDGRVIDASTAAQITTSEGQSYGLFFALVNRDRARFDQLLAWTQNNLAGGDLGARLPAWSWGRGDDGQWRVLDNNAASDSDVWIAYSLLAAAELWTSPEYRELGLALASRIIESESVELAGMGRVLLPGPTGFHPAEYVWRLNPSYWPISVLRGLAVWTQNAAWQSVVRSSETLLRLSAPQAVSPDWFLFNSNTGSITWPGAEGVSSYNAIRVYLWLGMMPFDDPLSASLRSHFSPWAKRLLVQGAVPERIDVKSAKALSDHLPIGFAQAALPYLQAQAEADDQRGLAAITATAMQPREGYYNEVLAMFSSLWREQRFRFTRDGRVQLAPECL